MIEIEDKIIIFLEQNGITPKHCKLKYNFEDGFTIESGTLKEEYINEINKKIKEIERAKIS
jgi:hypothetical protein